MSIFLAIYTNECKSYCDERFFSRISELGLSGMVIDNSRYRYYRRLSKLTSLPVIQMPQPKGSYLFQRNVFESVNRLRDEFLKTDLSYFLIIESDVIPPVDFLPKLLDYADNIPKAGIIGCLYYDGFQKFYSFPYQTNHVLSGCTLYRREVIKKYPFRIDLVENAGAFPDAWICWDISHGDNEWEFWNVPIVCEHVHTIIHNKPSRGQELLI